MSPFRAFHLCLGVSFHFILAPGCVVVRLQHRGACWHREVKLRLDHLEGEGRLFWGGSGGREGWGI